MPEPVIRTVMPFRNGQDRVNNVFLHYVSVIQQILHPQTRQFIQPEILVKNKITVFLLSKFCKFGSNVYFCSLKSRISPARHNKGPIAQLVRAADS